MTIDDIISKIDARYAVAEFEAGCRKEISDRAAEEQRYVEARLARLDGISDRAAEEQRYVEARLAAEMSWPSNAGGDVTETIKHHAEPAAAVQSTMEVHDPTAALSASAEPESVLSRLRRLNGGRVYDYTENIKASIETLREMARGAPVPDHRSSPDDQTMYLAGRGYVSAVDKIRPERVRRRRRRA